MTPVRSRDDEVGGGARSNPAIGRRLADRVVLLTGIGSGQGREAALLFAEHGAHVIGCDVDADGAEETVRLAADRALRIVSMAPVDLGDEAEAAAWIQDAATVHGRIDVLYNNAGAARFASVETQSAEDWTFTLRNEVNLLFFAIKHVWPHLKHHGGSIINIASTAALAGSATLPRAAHSAAKSAVIGLTRQVAAEGAPFRIRCNAISPGPTATPASQVAIFSDPHHPMRDIAAHIPLGRLASPLDVAFAALYLASNEAQYVTGANIVVDGGYSAVLPGAPLAEPTRSPGAE